jgi:hypothetical protein
MNVHQNARLTAHSRAALVRRVLDQGQPRKVVATAFSVDPKTVGKWVRRFQAEGVAGLTDNGAWQDVYPDAGYTPFRGTKGTVREGGNRVPSLAWGPGITAGSRNADILGGLDYMATFASLGGVKLPEKDREGEPIIFDSYDMSPVLFGSGKSQRKSWFYFTENELTPGAARVGQYKAVFNLRGADGAHTGGLAVDSNLRWKGAGVLRRDGAPGLRSLARPTGALRHLYE